MFTDGVAKVMSVVDTSPAWYTYYPRPVVQPPLPLSMREKHSSPRKMVMPCASPKQGSVNAPGRADEPEEEDVPFDLSRSSCNNNNNDSYNNGNGNDGDGRGSSSSPSSPSLSQRASPAAFKPYEPIVNDQPLDLRVDHKKSRRDELEDENQNLIVRTPSPEDIEVDSPGPPSVHQQQRHHHRDGENRNHSHHHHHHGNHHNHNNHRYHNHHRSSPCSSDKDADERRMTAVEDERRMVNYPVLFPPQPLHPMMLEAMYAREKSRLPGLSGYHHQPSGPASGYHHRPPHYPFAINSPLLNGHHHVPPPTYDVVRQPPPPPPPPSLPPVPRSPQQKTAFQETTGKPKDR